MASYSGNSIIDYLNSVGKASDFNSRAKLASQNGISNYTGTAAQNLQLLGILNKSGSSTSTSKTETPSTYSYSEDYTKSGDTPSSYYGAKERSAALESQSLQEGKAIGSSAVSSGIVGSNFMKTITNDPSIMAFYVNALTYGGYTMGDILNDMKRRELISQGNTQAKSVILISPTVERSTYQSSAEGQSSVTKASSLIPTFNLQGKLNPEILNYGVNIPDELFKQIVPISDNTSQEFKDAVEKLKSTYVDVMNAKLQATTEQQKSVADYNYQLFKDQINKKYGIILSDDATKAWSQIENIEGTFSTRGLSNTGMEKEAIDDSLKAVRLQDQRSRDNKLTEEQEKKASYYKSTATAAEIATLTPEERKNFGLTPSEEIKQKFSLDNLRTIYPDATDEELQAKHDAILDENGNYRSTLYNNYYSGVESNNDTQKTNAELVVAQNAKDEEARAYEQFDKDNVLNIQGGTGTGIQPDTAIKSENTKTYSANEQLPSSVTDPMIESIKKIQAGINSLKTTNPATSAVKTNPVVTPVKNTTPVITPSVKNPYKIVSGDTLSAIAAKNKTTVSNLAKLNNISNPNLIYAGQTIKLQ